MIGRLETFWLPAGYYVYVGSAFQAGGVAGRTARHLAGSGPRLWGLDDLRDFATPIGLWWTHHRVRLEHDWARALAGMPAYCSPAPIAGATDCNKGDGGAGGAVGERQRCPAHLFYTPRQPAAVDFAAQLGRSGSGGYAVYHQTVTWPEVGVKPTRNKRQQRQNSEWLSLFG